MQISSPHVTILDLGVGNVGSIASMFRHLGVENRIVQRRGSEGDPTHLVLPGVGSFDPAMAALEREGWHDLVRSHAERARPLLGICLGMHLLAEESEEGSQPGLGLLAASVRDVAGLGEGLRVPHMGWNHIRATRPPSDPDALTEPSRFYFAHSYHAVPSDDRDVVAWCHYGSDFAAIMHRGTTTGVQFHPEKSHAHGLSFLHGWIRGALW